LLPLDAENERWLDHLLPLSQAVMKYGAVRPTGHNLFPTFLRAWSGLKVGIGIILNDRLTNTKYFVPCKETRRRLFIPIRILAKLLIILIRGIEVIFVFFAMLFEMILQYTYCWLYNIARKD
jgi:hypothetical protein